MLKEIFLVKNSKSEHHDWILQIQISLGTKFLLKLTILNFLTRFIQKGLFSSKTGKVNNTFFYTILHIHISLVRNFSSNWTFWILESNLPKKAFPVENRNSKHHHGILYIWFSLGTKIELKLTILCFCTKFTKKMYFQSKTEQAVQGLQLLTFVNCCFETFWRSQRSLYLEHFERIIGYVLRPGLFLS